MKHFQSITLQLAEVLEKFPRGNTLTRLCQDYNELLRIRALIFKDPKSLTFALQYASELHGFTLELEILKNRRNDFIGSGFVEKTIDAVTPGNLGITEKDVRFVLPLVGELYLNKRQEEDITLEPFKNFINSLD